MLDLLWEKTIKNVGNFLGLKQQKSSLKIYLKRVKRFGHGLFTFKTCISASCKTRDTLRPAFSAS